MLGLDWDNGKYTGNYYSMFTLHPKSYALNPDSILWKCLGSTYMESWKDLGCLVKPKICGVDPGR